MVPWYRPGHRQCPSRPPGLFETHSGRPVQRLVRLVDQRRELQGHDQHRPHQQADRCRGMAAEGAIQRQGGRQILRPREREDLRSWKNGRQHRKPELVNPAAGFQESPRLTAFSRGLLTNTATGGWRRDFSLITEKFNSFPSSGLPSSPSSRQGPDYSKAQASGNSGRPVIYPWAVPQQRKRPPLGAGAAHLFVDRTG